MLVGQERPWPLLRSTETFESWARLLMLCNTRLIHLLTDFMPCSIIDIVNVLATFVAIALVDRVGRRVLLMVGAAWMFVTQV